MMICRADFEELFPDVFPAKRGKKRASAVTLARVEDNGGQPGAGPLLPLIVQTGFALTALATLATFGQIPLRF